MYLTTVQCFTLPGRWFSWIGGLPSGQCNRGNSLAWEEVSSAIFMPGRILVGLCLPPWKDWSSVHPVSYLVILYECLRCLRGLRWHYVSVFRLLNPHQCCNRVFKSVCPNVENKHLSSVLFYPHVRSHHPALVKSNNWIAEKLMSTGCFSFMVPLCEFCCVLGACHWDLDMQYPSILLPSGPGGGQNVWALREAVMSQRMPQAGQWG